MYLTDAGIGGCWQAVDAELQLFGVKLMKSSDRSRCKAALGVRSRLQAGCGLSTQQGQ